MAVEVRFMEVRRVSVSESSYGTPVYGLIVSMGSQDSALFIEENSTGGCTMGRLLIVVDMQKDFIDGSLGTKEAQEIVPKVAGRVKEYLAAGDEVIFTLDTHGEDYLDTLEGKKLPVKHCQKGSKGWELCRELSEVEGRRFEKDTFGSRECAEYAAQGNYSRVELVGLCTDICVISNALLIKAFIPQTPVWVNSACCAGVTPESHQNALKAMEMCQIEIS